MFKAVFYQLAGTLIVALLALPISGWQAAVSVAIGGAAVFLPNFFFAFRLSVIAAKQGGASPVAFFIGEFVKIAATIGLLAIAARQFAGLVWPAMLIGLAIALQANFLAIWDKSRHG